MKIELQSFVQREVHKSIRRHVIDGRRQIHREVQKTLMKYAVAAGIGSIAAVLTLWSGLRAKAKETAVSEATKQVEIEVKRQVDLQMKTSVEAMEKALTAAQLKFDKQYDIITAQWVAQTKVTDEQMHLSISKVSEVQNAAVKAQETVKALEKKSSEAMTKLEEVEENSNEVASKFISFKEAETKLANDLQEQQAGATATKDALAEVVKMDVQAQVKKAQDFLKQIDALSGGKTFERLAVLDTAVDRLTALDNAVKKLEEDVQKRIPFDAKIALQSVASHKVMTVSGGTKNVLKDMTIVQNEDSKSGLQMFWIKDRSSVPFSEMPDLLPLLRLFKRD